MGMDLKESKIILLPVFHVACILTDVCSPTGQLLHGRTGYRDEPRHSGYDLPAHPAVPGQPIHHPRGRRDRTLRQEVRRSQLPLELRG